MKVNLNLRQMKNADKETPIYLVCTINGKQEKFATGQKICPKYWNKVRNLAIVSNEQPRIIQQQHEAINKELAHLLNKVTEWEDYMLDHPEQISDSVNLLRKFLANEIGRLEICPLNWFEQAINDDYNIASGSKNKYLNDLKTVRTFIEEKKVKAKTFSDITYQFLKKYEEYMFDKGFTMNTIINKMRALLTVINKADRNGLINKITSGLSRYQIPKNKEEGQQIYLTETDLAKLEKVELSGNEEKLRDLFLLQCHIGQRYGDMLRLDEAIITEKNITLVQEKTAKKVVIPLSDDAKAILKKYDNKMPHIGAEYANELLKSIGKKAGIDDEQLITKQEKGKTITKKVPKYELMKTHTARRTFVTISIKRGLQPSIIMKITGHTSTKTMERYNKMTADDAAEAMFAILDDEEKKIEKKAEKLVAERLEVEKEKIEKKANERVRKQDEKLKHVALNQLRTEMKYTGSQMALGIGLDKEGIPLDVGKRIIESTFSDVTVSVAEDVLTINGGVAEDFPEEDCLSDE